MRIDHLIELNNTNTENLEFTKVTRFHTKKSIATNTTLPMFVVHLSPSSNANNLNRINKILYQTIRWEKLKTNKTVQCWNCQSLGHSSNNCNLPYRCVKCTEKHEPGQCLIDSSNTEHLIENKNKLHCILCGNSGHPASYRGCPVHLSKQKEIKKTQLNL